MTRMSIFSLDPEVRQEHTKNKKMQGFFALDASGMEKMNHVSVIRPNGMIFHQPRFH